MPESEKELNGLPHKFDNEMMRMFHRACKLTQAYNQTGEDETAKRAEITIGNQVLIGPNVSLYTVNHAINPEERAQGIFSETLNNSQTS